MASSMETVKSNGHLNPIVMGKFTLLFGGQFSIVCAKSKKLKKMHKCLNPVISCLVIFPKEILRDT